MRLSRSSRWTIQFTSSKDQNDQIQGAGMPAVLALLTFDTATACQPSDQCIRSYLPVDHPQSRRHLVRYTSAVRRLGAQTPRWKQYARRLSSRWSAERESSFMLSGLKEENRRRTDGRAGDGWMLLIDRQTTSSVLPTDRWWNNQREKNATTFDVPVRFTSHHHCSTRANQVLF